MTLSCKNLKVTFDCKYDIDIRLVQHKCVISNRRISIIIRALELGCVFTIYNHNLKALHCTGIKHVHIIPEIIKFIEYELHNEALTTCIDNSLFTCKQSISISLKEVINKVAKSANSIYYCTHSTEIFPALFLKPILKKTGLPSVILFHNSSYVLIGGKSIEKVKLANHFVKQFLLLTNQKV